MTWTQVYTPLGGSLAFSTIVAAVPVVLLLGLLAFFHARAHVAAIIGLAAALFSSSAALQERFLGGAEAGILKLNQSTADAELDECCARGGEDVLILCAARSERAPQRRKLSADHRAEHEAAGLLEGKPRVVELGGVIEQHAEHR